MAMASPSPTSPSSFRLLLPVSSPRHQLGLLSLSSSPSSSDHLRRPTQLAVVVHGDRSLAAGNAWQVGLAAGALDPPPRQAAAAAGGGGMTNAVFLDLRPMGGGGALRRPAAAPAGPRDGRGGVVVHAMARDAPLPGAGPKTN